MMFDKLSSLFKTKEKDVKETVKEELSFKINFDLPKPSLPEIHDRTKADLRYPLLLPYAYAHLKWDEVLGEIVYLVEEPSLDVKEKEVLNLLEQAIQELIDISFINVDDKQVLIEYLEKNVNTLLIELAIQVEKYSYLKIMYYLYRDFIGLNKIEPLMNDQYIEDIECNGKGTPIYVIHRKFGAIRTNVIYEDFDELKSFVEKMAQKCGKYVSYANPIVDGRLPEGSIDYNEPIIYREKGAVKIKKIGDFVDKYYANECTKPIGVEDIEVPAFDTNTLKIEWKKVDYVYRHKVNEDLYHLKLETGRNLKLTGCHSVFIVKEEGVRSIKTSDIKGGDYAVIPLRIPENDVMKEFNLVKGLSNKKCSSKLWVEGVPYDLFIEKRNIIKDYIDKHYNHPYEAYYELRKKKILPINLYEIIPEYMLRGCKIKTTSPRKIPTFLKIDKNLMRLLGYYLAEGWLSNPIKHHNYNLLFSFNKNEKAYHKEVIEAIKDCFGLETYIAPEDKNAVKLILNSFIVWHVFKDVFKIEKIGAKNKEIPDLVYNVNRELREEFIKCYTNGDYGSSASERLMSDLAYLNLFDNKIMSYYNRERQSIFEKDRKVISREYYTNNLMRGYTDYFKTIPVEIFNPLNKTHIDLRNKRVSRIRLKGLLESIRYKRFLNLNNLDNVKFFIEWSKRGFLEGGKLTLKGKQLLEEVGVVNSLISSDLAFIKIKNIERCKPSSEFVYDVSVKGCENFIGGMGGICCHNSRLNATYTEDVTSRGPSFTIRKFTREAWSCVKLMQVGTISAEILSYLWLLIENGCNILIVGGTGSGKTTILNVMASFIPPQARIVSIEDTKELRLMHENWLPSVARVGTGVGGEGTGEVSLFDLLKASFRQRPDYVIVGEIRGQEAFVLFQGMGSGHAGLSTMHADDVKTVIRRLETEPINLSPSLVETLDIICLISFAKVKGKDCRKVRAIQEIISIKENGDADVNTPFKWDAVRNVFMFNKNSVVFKKIVEKKGISLDNLNIEFVNRTKVLNAIYKNNIVDFEDVQKIIHAYYKDKESVLKRFALL